MEKASHIYLSLQIKKDIETNGLLLDIHFDPSAPNFSIQDEAMSWNPTLDELDFISEVFDLVNKRQLRQTTNEEIDLTTVEEEKRMRYQPPASSEKKSISPNSLDESGFDSDQTQSLEQIELDEKIFVQADEKKIDEIIRRKKLGFKEDHMAEPGEKTYHLLKQKKRKE